MTVLTRYFGWAAAIAVAAFGMTCLTATASAQRIQHDAEHYVLLHQYADQWAAEDKEIDQRLAEIRERASTLVHDVMVRAGASLDANEPPCEAPRATVQAHDRQVRLPRAPVV